MIDVRKYFSFQEIEIKRQQSQHSQIFAFIQYADIKSVVRALKSKTIHDHSIKVNHQFRRKRKYL